MSGIGSGVSAGPAACFCVFLRDHSASQRPVLPSLGLQYDLSTSTFSPDGRVFQTDYAQKAVDNSGCGRRQKRRRRRLMCCWELFYAVRLMSCLIMQQK